MTATANRSAAFRLPAPCEHGGSVRSAARSAKATRGQARQFWQMFDKSLVPMVIVDNERRYRAGNRAARLLFRLSLVQLLERRIEDLTPPHMDRLLDSAWARLLRDRCVAGEYDVGFPDGSFLRIFYSAIANVLPGQHLIVFAPADWPEDELGTTEDLAGTPVPGSLSVREREVLSLVGAGASSNQIAAELTISAATVNTHVKNVLRKLDARNRAHAIALATQLGLVDPPPRWRNQGDQAAG